MLDQDWPVERLAAEAALSPRGLHRHFRDATGQIPGGWLVAQRVARARHLLEGTAIPIEDLAVSCGFGSATTLRHHFRSMLGSSPTAYRARFSTTTT